MVSQVIYLIVQLLIYHNNCPPRGKNMVLVLGSLWGVVGVECVLRIKKKKKKYVYHYKPFFSHSYTYKPFHLIKNTLSPLD